MIRFICMWALLLGSMAAAGASPNDVQGGGWLVNADDEVAGPVLCTAGQTLRITATAVSGGALSSGDTLALQLVDDLDGNPASLLTWASTDMPVDQVHACIGRNRQYRVILDDDDDSSDVNVELWVSGF